MKLRRTNSVRTLSLTALVLIAPLVVTSCASSSQAAGKNPDGSVVVRYEGGANGVNLPELAEDLGYLDGVDLQWVGNNTSGPASIQNTATGATDLGSAFSGAVVKLQEAGAKVTGVVSSYGSNEASNYTFYVREDSDIKEPKDLIGKSVAVNTLGAHSEAVLSSFLRQSGLSEDEIKQVQLVVLPPSDTEQAIRSGQVDVGALSSVFQEHALAQGGVRKFLRDVDVYGDFNGGQYVLRDDFIAQNPEATRTLATGIGKAADWANSHSREEVVERLTDIIQKRGRGESTEPLKYFRSFGVGEHGAVKDEDFTRWAQWLNDTGIVQGEITPGDYYTNEYNDLANGK
ncbi:ABC transporter substrate-binding protein [Glutamicibacter sp.]|uniref:ABC transporter substrate-binding protein n=1 Tax=Glutamicibacter sp. TaxID=1931995 RepID=UPI0028BDE143|nr:ABC transporter substrate-binding protein [Glutamicibacter sp.]